MSSNKQRRYYSGKNKHHTLKMQLVVDKATGTIICVARAAGRWQDCRLFKQSPVRSHPDTKAITDTGYMGLQKLHGHTILPKKRSQKYPLNKEDK